MGAIQNSLSNILSTAMGAVIGVSHIANQQAQLATAERQELASLSETIPQSEAAVQNQESNVKEAALRKEAIDKGYEPGSLDIDIASNSYTGYKRMSTSGQSYDQLKAAQALKTAQGVLSGKQSQLELKKKRFQELSEKYGGIE